MKQRNYHFRNKNTKYGGSQSLLILIVIAVLILVNVIVNKLPVSITQFDISNAGIFTLSQQTVDLVENLEEDIHIYLLAQTGNEDQDIVRLLNRYQELSDHIKVEYKDTVLYPTFVSQYTDTQPSESSLIVESSKRSLVVDYNDIYVYDSFAYYYTGQMDITFDGEGKITSAIDYVTSDTLPVLYVLNGHGESVLTQSYQAAISKQNIEMRDLNLLSTGSVPEDASCLLIYSPASDFNQEETAAILAYLENGGNLILYTDYLPDEKPNLASILEAYGVQPTEGIIIEGDANQHLRGYAHYLLPVLEDHAITQPLIDHSSQVMFPIAQGIEETPSHRSSLQITNLLTTSDASYHKADVVNMSTFDQEAGDQQGPFSLGVAITEAFEDKETKIVWYTCGNSMTDEANLMVSGGNSDLFLNTLSWTCGREDSISIHAKNLTSEKLMLTAAQSNVWSIVLVIVVPLVVLLAGGLIWYRRRKR